MFAPDSNRDKVFDIALKISQDRINVKGTEFNTFINRIEIKEIISPNVLADSIAPSIKDYVSHGVTYADLCHILKTVYGVSGTLCKTIIDLLVKKLNFEIIEDPQPKDIRNQRKKETYLFAPRHGSDEIYEIAVEITVDHIDDRSAAYYTLIEDIYIKGKLTAHRLAEIIEPSIKDHISSAMTYADFCHILKTVYGIAGTLCERIRDILVKRLGLYTTIDNRLYIRST